MISTKSTSRAVVFSLVLTLMMTGSPLAQVPPRLQWPQFRQDLLVQLVPWGIDEEQTSSSRRDAESRYRMPSVGPNDMWISSIPPGMKVYVAPEAEEAEAEQSSAEEGWTPLLAEHYVISDKNLKGTTPIRLRNVNPGNYLVAIAPIAILDRELNSTGTADPTMTIKALVRFFPLASPQDMEAIRSGRVNPEGAFVYSIRKEPDESKPVIILAIPDESSAEVLDSLYPKGQNFEFDNEALKEDLRQRHVSESDIPSCLELLHRGGKVRVKRGDLRWIVEITGNNTWNIDMQAKLPVQ